MDGGEDDGRLWGRGTQSIEDRDRVLGAITICGHQGAVMILKPHSTALKQTLSLQYDVSEEDDDEEV